MAKMANRSCSTFCCLIIVCPLVFFTLSLISFTFVSVSSFHVCISSPRLKVYCLGSGFSPMQAHAQDPREESSLNASHIENGSSMKKIADNSSTLREDGHEDHIQYVQHAPVPAPVNESLPEKAHVPEKALENSRQCAARPVDAIEEQVHRIRSLVQNRTSNRTCQGKGIFVYDLPAKFNKELVKRCGDILPWVNFCEFFKNRGMGKRVLGLGPNWYSTNQFSLELIFHSRIVNHPCRVSEEGKASLFYIPFYGGLTAIKANFHNFTLDEKDRLGLELMKWIKMKKSWIQNQGKDHVVALGTLSWDMRRKGPGGWGTNFLELKEMQNPIKLTIERQAWDSNDIGIPYPTNFHPSTDKDITKHQSKLSKSKRKTFSSFVGAGRPNMKTNVRSALIKQCMSNSTLCTYLDCTVVDCVNPRTVISLMMNSEFCLQPPGDSATRKSFFDSLVYGCIPVVFNPFTAYYQYPWHLPEDCRRYSVYIDEEQVKQGTVNVKDVLSGISVKERKEMRRYIIFELMPRIIYANFDSKLGNFHDAFDISIDNLLHMVA